MPKRRRSPGRDSAASDDSKGVNPMVPQQQPSRQAQRWIAAYQRAMAEGLIPVYVDGQVYKVKGYDVVVLGARWDDLACTCPAGAHGRICKHQAVVAKS